MRERQFLPNSSASDGSPRRVVIARTRSRRPAHRCEPRGFAPHPQRECERLHRSGRHESAPIPLDELGDPGDELLITGRQRQGFHRRPGGPRRN